MSIPRQLQLSTVVVSTVAVGLKFIIVIAREERPLYHQARTCGWRLELELGI
jgi:hypothetical protein